MTHVDALSRSPNEPPMERIQQVSSKDPKLSNIISLLNGIKKSDQARQSETEYCLQNHRLYRKTTNGLRFVIPKNIHWRICIACHDDIGHVDLGKTLERIERTFWSLRKCVR